MVASWSWVDSICPQEEPMDPNAKKTTLRMIPYGLYVLTAAGKDGQVAAGTVNWVTQASFEPPLVAVGVKTDSHAHALIKDTKAFALNVLGKGQQVLAFTFFKPAERKGDTISGEPFRPGTTAAPIRTSTPACWSGSARPWCPDGRARRRSCRLSARPA